MSGGAPWPQQPLEGDRAQAAPGLGHRHHCKVPVSPTWAPWPPMDGLRGHQCPAHLGSRACDGTGPTEAVMSGLCLAGDRLGVPACTKAPKDIPTAESKGTSPQGLLHPSLGQMGRAGAAATPVQGLAVPWDRKGQPSPDSLMQQHPSAPCPLAAKQEPALDAPGLMGTGLIPTSPVSPVSTRQPPRLGIAPHLRQ